jgi:hypothetical protein
MFTPFTQLNISQDEGMGEQAFSFLAGAELTLELANSAMRY